MLLKAVRSKSLARSVVFLAAAAFVLAPIGVTGGSLPGLSDLASVASAAQGFELGPAPQVTDSSMLAPTVSAPIRAGSMAVNTSDRQAVVNLFNSVYTPALAVQPSWTGSVPGCIPGSNSAAYDTATISMVNYFRAMAGLPDNITLDTAASVSDQQAALMMIATGTLSHTPDPSFLCYTPAGATAAGTSNLALGVHGPAAVVGYVQDPGAGNTAVGHRRWILYPPETSMGNGNTTATFNSIQGAFIGSNALGVIGNFGNRPASPEFVSWPPPGFVPFQVVYPRWSFSLPNADFSQATVTMTQGASPVGLTLLPLSQGFGDNTIAWEPIANFASVATDTPYTVNLGNVRVNNVARSFSYTVTLINPATGGVGATATPTSLTGPVGGKGLGISASGNSVNLTWSTGTGQSGYNVFRLNNGVVSKLNASALAAGTITFTDTTPGSGLNCYALQVLGPNPPQFSDFLCDLVGFHSASNTPQNFTMRLNQSPNTAAFTWTPPPAGSSFDGYQLVKLGAGTQSLGPTIQSTLGSTSGLTCFALAATLSGNIVGWTDFECGLPSFGNLNP